MPDHLNAETFWPAATWKDVVDYSISEEVDGVIISGDIIDEENAYFEAFGPFEDGAKLLDIANIPTFVVAGNHDYDSVPNLIENLDVSNVHLLGANGTWERHTVGAAENPRYHVDGWSFPSRHFYHSPFDDYEFDVEAAPVIGIVHGDIYDDESDYAPIEEQELETTPADAWILGHIHKPNIIRETDPAIFYPGSPQALAPNEEGTHGPWLLELAPSGAIKPTQIPLAKVQYGTVTVDISDVDDLKDVAPLLRDGIRDTVPTQLESDSVVVFIARIDLVGQTPLHNKLLEQTGPTGNQTDLSGNIQPEVEGIPVHIDQISIKTKPAIDLDEFTDTTEPAGYLAALIRDLEAGNHDPHADLIQKSTDAVERATNGNAYAPLADKRELPEPTAQEASERLLRQARALLQELHQQKEDAR